MLFNRGLMWCSYFVIYHLSAFQTQLGPLDEDGSEINLKISANIANVTPDAMSV